jgi:hypothetical protein
MQTLELQRSTQRTFSLQEWLNAKSEFYSGLMEEPISRVQVVRVHLAFVSLVLIALLIEQQPVLACVMAACAGWLVYRINKGKEVSNELVYK